MYRLTQPILFSWFPDPETASGAYDLLPSNGSYVRSYDRKTRYTINAESEKRIPFRFSIGDQSYAGVIADTVLAARITEYMREYHGKRWTNCSAFANFLTTGSFIECDENRNLFVLSQSMRAYKGESVGVGDMVCIFYANDRLCRSRRLGFRGDYLKAKKKRRRNAEFTHGLTPRNAVMAPEEIEEIAQNPIVSEYHFLVCVAKKAGKPVWLSQRGRYHPTGESSPLIFTLGNDDGCMGWIPILTLIKKRR